MRLLKLDVKGRLGDGSVTAMDGDSRRPDSPAKKCALSAVGLKLTDPRRFKGPQRHESRTNNFKSLSEGEQQQHEVLMQLEAIIPRR